MRRINLLVGVCFVVAALSGCVEETNKAVVSNLRYDEVNHILKWDANSSYRYEVKLNGKTILMKSINSGVTSWSNYTKNGVGEIYLNTRELQNEMKVRTYNPQSGELGEWATISYNLSTDKLSIPLVETFFASVASHYDDNLDTILSFGYSEERNELYFSPTYRDEDREYTFYITFDDDYTYTSLLDTIKDYYNDKNIFYALDEKGTDGGYYHFYDKYDFLEHIVTWDDTFCETLNKYKSNGYTFEVIKSLAFYKKNISSLSRPGFDGLIKATNGDDVVYLSAFMEFAGPTEPLGDVGLNGLFAKTGLKDSREKSAGFFRLEGDLVDLAMMMEYNDPYGENTPFYEKDYESNPTYHWHENTHLEMIGKRLNYEFHSWNQWEVDDDPDYKKHECNVCAHVGRVKQDSTDILVFDGSYVRFTSDEEKLNEYPFDYVTIPDEREGVKITTFRGSIPKKLQSQLKRITFGDGIKRIENVDWSKLVNLEYVHLPSNMTCETFPTSLPNIDYVEYENGLYLGNEDNPYLIYCGHNIENPSEIKVHKDTRMIEAKTFRVESLKSLSVPFLGIVREDSSFNDSWTRYLYNYGDNLEYLEIYDGTTTTYVETDYTHLGKNLRTLKLGEGVKSAELTFVGVGGAVTQIYLPSTLESFSSFTPRKSAIVIEYKGTKDEWLSVMSNSHEPIGVSPYPTFYVYTSDYRITYTYQSGSHTYYPSYHAL